MGSWKRGSLEYQEYVKNLSNMVEDSMLGERLANFIHEQKSKRTFDANTIEGKFIELLRYMDNLSSPMQEGESDERTRKIDEEQIHKIYGYIEKDYQTYLANKKPGEEIKEKDRLLEQIYESAKMIDEGLKEAELVEDINPLPQANAELLAADREYENAREELFQAMKNFDQAVKEGTLERIRRVEHYNLLYGIKEPFTSEGFLLDGEELEGLARGVKGAEDYCQNNQKGAELSYSDDYEKLKKERDILETAVKQAQKTMDEYTSENSYLANASEDYGRSMMNKSDMIRLENENWHYTEDAKELSDYAIHFFNQISQLQMMKEENLKNHESIDQEIKALLAEEKAAEKQHLADEKLIAKAKETERLETEKLDSIAEEMSWLVAPSNSGQPFANSLRFKGNVLGNATLKTRLVNVFGAQAEEVNALYQYADDIEKEYFLNVKTPTKNLPKDVKAAIEVAKKEHAMGEKKIKTPLKNINKVTQQKEFYETVGLFSEALRKIDDLSYEAERELSQKYPDKELMKDPDVSSEDMLMFTELIEKLHDNKGTLKTAEEVKDLYRLSNTFGKLRDFANSLDVHANDAMKAAFADFKKGLSALEKLGPKLREMNLIAGSDNRADVNAIIKLSIMKSENGVLRNLRDTYAKKREEIGKDPKKQEAIKREEKWKAAHEKREQRIQELKEQKDIARKCDEGIEQLENARKLALAKMTRLKMQNVVLDARKPLEEKEKQMQERKQEFVDKVDRLKKHCVSLADAKKVVVPFANAKERFMKASKNLELAKQKVPQERKKFMDGLMQAREKIKQNAIAREDELFDRLLKTKAHFGNTSAYKDMKNAITNYRELRNSTEKMDSKLYQTMSKAYMKTVEDYIKAKGDQKRSMSYGQTRMDVALELRRLHYNVNAKLQSLTDMELAMPSEVHSEVKLKSFIETKLHEQAGAQLFDKNVVNKMEQHYKQQVEANKAKAAEANKSQPQKNKEKTNEKAKQEPSIKDPVKEAQSKEMVMKQN